jgi:hypothetical protein
MEEQSWLTTGLEEAAELLDKLMSKDITSAEVQEAEVLKRIKDKLKEKTAALAQSRTATLWLQYMDMVEILHNLNHVHICSTS